MEAKGLTLVETWHENDSVEAAFASKKARPEGFARFSALGMLPAVVEALGGQQTVAEYTFAWLTLLMLVVAVRDAGDKQLLSYLQEAIQQAEHKGSWLMHFLMHVLPLEAAQAKRSASIVLPRQSHGRSSRSLQRWQGASKGGLADEGSSEADTEVSEAWLAQFERVQEIGELYETCWQSLADVALGRISSEASLQGVASVLYGLALRQIPN